MYGTNNILQLKDLKAMDVTQCRSSLQYHSKTFTDGRVALKIDWINYVHLQNICTMHMACTVNCIHYCRNIYSQITRPVKYAALSATTQRQSMTWWEMCHPEQQSWMVARCHGLCVFSSQTENFGVVTPHENLFFSFGFLGGML